MMNNKIRPYYEADTGAGAGAGVPEGTQHTEGPQSFDDVLKNNKNYQSEFDRRVAKALDTAKAKWAEQAAAERAEASRLAKVAMEEQRQQREQLDKDWEKLRAERKQFMSEYMEREAARLLAEQNVPTSFARLLKADTKEDTAANVAAFAEEYKQSLTQSINERLKAPSPRAGSHATVDTAIRQAAGLRD